jgi:hypothetical protein
MNSKMVDVTLHIDEEIDATMREVLRDNLLHMQGVMAADSHSRIPHLMIIEYDPDIIEAMEFLAVVKQRGLHAELIGM